MPSWTLDSAPTWAKNAIATDRGWVDPNNGEILVAHKRLNNAVSYAETFGKGVAPVAKKKRGGARPGAGRKTNAQRAEKAEAEAQKKAEIAQKKADAKAAKKAKSDQAKADKAAKKIAAALSAQVALGEEMNADVEAEIAAINEDEIRSITDEELKGEGA